MLHERQDIGATPHAVDLDESGQRFLKAWQLWTNLACRSLSWRRIMKDHWILFSTSKPAAHNKYIDFKHLTFVWSSLLITLPLLLEHRRDVGTWRPSFWKPPCRPLRFTWQWDVWSLVWTKELGWNPLDSLWKIRGESWILGRSLKKKFLPVDQKKHRSYEVKAPRISKSFFEVF